MSTIVDLLRRWFGTPIERIEPGVDPTDKPVVRRRLSGSTLFLILTGLAFAAVLGARAMTAKAAQPAPEDGSAPVETQNLASLQTATQPPSPSPTASPTGILEQFGGQVPTRQAAPMDCPAAEPPQIVVVTRVAPAAPAPLCPGPVEQTVEVPVVVTRVVTQLATVVISATPEPTQTPWVIVVEVTREVTPTPTQTPTPLPPSPTPTATGLLETFAPTMAQAEKMN